MITVLRNFVKTPFRVVIAYLTFVLLFAGFYWLVWHLRPDAFIIHDEFNKFPTESLWQGLEFDGRKLPPPSDKNNISKLPEGSELTSAISKWHRDKMITLSQIEALRPRMFEAQTARNEADQLAQTARTKNAELFKAGESGPALKEVERLSKELFQLEARFPTSSGMRSAEGEYAVAVVRSRLAKAKSNLAVCEHSILERINSNPHSFDDTELNAACAAANEVVKQLDNKFESLNEENLRLNVIGHELWAQRGSTVHARLGFLDFIYFSLGVSTTTTFGDIIPNSQWARGLVIAQLLLFTVLVAFLVSHIVEAARGK